MTGTIYTIWWFVAVILAAHQWGLAWLLFNMFVPIAPAIKIAKYLKSL